MLDRLDELDAPGSVLSCQWDREHDYLVAARAIKLVQVWGFDLAICRVRKVFMSRNQLLVVAAGMGLLFCPAAPRAEGAAFNVYYRASAASPWVYYAGKATKAAAQITVTKLKELGYLTEIIADGAASPATIIAPVAGARRVVGGYIVGGGATAAASSGGGSAAAAAGSGGGASAAAASSSGHVGSSSAAAAAGSPITSYTTHHYAHHHAHYHAGATAGAHHHPTHHPHHNVHHLDYKHHNPHGKHGAPPHPHGHHAHHHGGHHAQHHAHHHAHSHHHGKK